MFKLIRATFLGLSGMAFALSAYADITFVSWGGAYTASQQKATQILGAKAQELLLKITTVVLEKLKLKQKQAM